jgi:hypothetical protein
MTYAVYLTHAWPVWVALGSRRDLIDISTRSLLVLCGGILLSAFTLAFIFTIMFESPLFHILDGFKARRRSKSLPDLPAQSELMKPPKLAPLEASPTVCVLTNGHGINNNEAQDNESRHAEQNLRGWQYTAP